MSQTNPKFRKSAVLFIKALNLKIFSSKSADNADTGQIFLNDGGSNTFCNISIHKSFGDFGTEEERIKYNNRNKYYCYH